ACRNVSRSAATTAAGHTLSVYRTAAQPLTRSAPLLPRLDPLPLAHQTNRIFALVTVLLTELVQQPALGFFTPLSIPPSQPFHLFVSIQFIWHFHLTVLGLIFP